MTLREMASAEIEDGEYDTSADHEQWCDAVPVLVERVCSTRRLQPDAERPEGDTHDHGEPQHHNKIVRPSRHRTPCAARRDAPRSGPIRREPIGRSGAARTLPECSSGGPR